MEEADHDLKYELLVLGCSGVGKTALIQNYIKGVFTDIGWCTIGKSDAGIQCTVYSSVHKK